MSILCSGELITSAIEDVGENITVQTITIDGYNEWGDSTESTSDATVKVMVTQLSGNELIVKEGGFAAGDLRIFFKSADSSYCVVGNKIQRGNRWFQIKSVIDTYSTYFVEIIASRI